MTSFARRWMTTRLTALGLGVSLLLPSAVQAHCDTLDGPVVSAARIALQKGDVTPVLRWVQPKDEAAIREAFARTLAVRRLGPEAKGLADSYFFETLVRIHRAGEGAPYTGLKPAGTTEPGIALADEALGKGSIDRLLETVTAEVGRGIQERFDRVLKTRKHADESVPAGREYVEAYVTFIHYIEAIHEAARAAGSPHQAHESEARSEHAGDRR